MLKSTTTKFWSDCINKNFSNILKLLEKQPNAKLLDLGCSDGDWTIKVATRIGTTRIYGIDIDSKATKRAVEKGIMAITGNLNENLPFKDSFFDVVHANSVIEHLINLDRFTSEVRRVLRRNGYAVISTPNLSSTVNLFALLLGQQAFSQDISEEYRIGNIFSPHFGEKINSKYMTHKIVLTYFGIQQLFRLYGFKIEKVLGVGYFPFFNFFAKLDPLHSHYITLKARKS